MASAERKRCSNMAPVRRLRSLAWMKARRLPGVRCSTLKTRCSWSLCLMIMPGRICVAGIAIRVKLLALVAEVPRENLALACLYCSLGAEKPSQRSCGHGILSPVNYQLKSGRHHEKLSHLRYGLSGSTHHLSHRRCGADRLSRAG